MLCYLLSLCVASAIVGCKDVSVDSSSRYLQYKGVTLEAPPEPVDPGEMDTLSRLNINAVALVPYAFARKGSAQLAFNSDFQWWGETSEGTTKMCRMARGMGYAVMVKPQVWLHDDWIGNVDFTDEKAWQQWEAAYTDYILTYAREAERDGAEIFCVGTELSTVALRRTGFMKKLITEVRAVYSGKLTYAANWDTYERILFWDALDFIGVNAYFPLSQKENPVTAELLLAWKKPLGKMRELHQKYGKPILFTECGYRSVDYAAGKQWEIDGGKPNPDLQARAFTAMLNSIADEPWIAGIFIWKWEVSSRGSRHKKYVETGYSPKNKPAEKVISDFFREKGSGE